MNQRFKTAMQTFLFWCPIALMFPVLGLFIGWMVGQSREPAVNALLPLLFGLAGGLGYGFLEARFKSKKLLEVLGEDADRVKDVLGQGAELSPTFPPMWGLAVLVFCGTCFYGIQLGIEQRAGRYQNLGEYLDDLGVGTDKSKLHGDELASLYTIWWRLQSQGIPENEAKELLESVLPSALGQSQDVQQQKDDSESGQPDAKRMFKIEDIVAGKRRNRVEAIFGPLYDVPVQQVDHFAAGPQKSPQGT